MPRKRFRLPDFALLHAPFNLAHRNRSDFCDLRLRCPSRTSEIASDFRDKTRGGGLAQPLLVGSPGQRLSTRAFVCAMCGCICVPVCMLTDKIYVRLVWSLSGCFFWIQERAGEALGHFDSEVLETFFASCYASVCGAVPGTGGAIGPFGVPVPTATPQNIGAAHGPRHPAYTA